MICFGFRPYQWIDDRGKKCKCSASQYIDYVMSFSQKHVHDESVFPTKYGKYLERLQRLGVSCWQRNQKNLVGINNKAIFGHCSEMLWPRVFVNAQMNFLTSAK